MTPELTPLAGGKSTLRSRKNEALAVETEGFCILRSAVGLECIDRLNDCCAKAFRTDINAENARSSQGHIYAARNVIDFIPEVKTVWQKGAMAELLLELLGDDFGLVRALFFDKPPDRTWALPWHKDATIAVADNALPSEHFSRPTLKAGVPHVIASDAILGQMLTLRIHLDDVDDTNGPLKVIPRSHFSKDNIGDGPESAVTIFASAGDVLAMRPLIDHASGSSKEGAARHRRILHLEFAGMPELPDGYRWHRFVAHRDRA